MAETSVTVVVNGDQVEVDNIKNDAVRLLVANLQGETLKMLQTLMAGEVMPAIKNEIAAGVSAVIADFEANGWPEIDRHGRLTGNRVKLSVVVTNLILRAFGAADILDPYPCPDSLAVEPMK